MSIRLFLLAFSLLLRVPAVKSRQNAHHESTLLSNHHQSVAAPLVDLIRRLPKAELHIHIEGTLEPELMFAIAKRNRIQLPYPDLQAAKAARENFTDLQSFLDAYHIAQSVLRTPQDFEDLATEYLNRAAADNITHVEIFFDPQGHAQRGVPFKNVFTGLSTAIQARRQHPTHPIDAHLIVCFMRDLGQFAAARTLITALPYIRNITGIGLASTELGYPPEMFKDVYRTGTLLGLHKVAHAGEEGGPDYVWQAINTLGVERVDHGIRSIEDPQLVAHMVDHKLPITLCPLSNLHLQVYHLDLPEKLQEVLSSGIIVTINSDDPAYFSGYLNANYEYVASVANLGADDIAKLARNSFAASFIPGDQKLQAYAQIRDVLAAWKGEQQQQLLNEQQQVLVQPA